VRLPHEHHQPLPRFHRQRRIKLNQLKDDFLRFKRLGFFDACRQNFGDFLEIKLSN
jgi:hypothetical protein